MQISNEALKSTNQDLKEQAGKILQNHLTSFQENDVKSLLKDYTDESELITPDGNFKGIAEIKIFFESLIPFFPKGESVIALEKTVIKDNLIYFVWNAKTPRMDVSLATDTILLKHGKISIQTFAAKYQII